MLKSQEERLQIFTPSPKALKAENFECFFFRCPPRADLLSQTYYIIINGEAGNTSGITKGGNVLVQ